MDVEVNILGVLAAVVVASVIGAVWYAKALFGVEWMKLAKVSEKQAQKEAPKAMAVMLILVTIAAYALAWLSYVVFVFLGEESFVAASVQTALMAWVGFVFYAQVSNGMFEQRPQRLIMINVGNSLATFLAMGLVIGLIGL